MSRDKNTRLSVNVDHVATLRQARRAAYPEPVEAALLAERAGAGGITVHLREDRRHIQDDDVRELRERIAGKLNLEIAGTEAMVRFALETKPDQVSLVPERPDEITTEGGLDLLSQGRRIQRVASSLANAGIEVSVFVDPEPAQIEQLIGLKDVIGFEINTDRYAQASGDAVATELNEIRQVAHMGADASLKVYAGHALRTDNVAPIAAVGPIEELNIGHFIVSRAVLVGMDRAVTEMLDVIRQPTGGSDESSG